MNTIICYGKNIYFIQLAVKRRELEVRPDVIRLAFR